jgi:phage-related holin
MDNFLGVLRYFWAKVLFTIPVCFYTFNEDHFLIVYALILVVFVDTLLGVGVSVKYRISRSHLMGRISSKIYKYLVALLSMWVLSIVEPTLFGWTFKAFGVFLILTEVLSNLEKLSLLGLDIPSKLLSKLNKDFHDFYFGTDDEKKIAVKKIINKEQRKDF